MIAASLINNTADQPMVECSEGARIINGISIILPILGAAHSDFARDNADGLSVGENITALLNYCRELITNVKQEAANRQIPLSAREENVIHAACLNTVLLHAHDIVRQEGGDGITEDISGHIVNVLTAAEIAKTRGLSNREDQGMPLTVAALMEVAAAVAIYVSSSKHVAYSQHGASVKLFLEFIDSATQDARTLLRLSKIKQPTDLDKIQAVITREIGRLFIAVAEHQEKEKNTEFDLQNTLARACVLSNAFISGVDKVAALHGEE